MTSESARVFLGENVRVQARLPQSPFARDTQVFERRADMAVDHVPVELGIAVVDVFHIVVTGVFVGAGSLARAWGYRH